MLILNERQQKFVDLAVDWFYNSPSKLLQLAGYAGTGKSVVISEILRRLNLPINDVLPMAYTGQACTIMRKNGLSNACTCHSGLFFVSKEIDTVNGHPNIDSTFNIPLLKWKFLPKDFSTSSIKLIILDEAWMIPKKFKKYIDNTGIKVIPAGHPGQLPPVADDPGYLVDGDIFFLTDLMRQSKDSAIIYLANRARNGLPLEPGLYNNEALVIYDDELDNEMISRSDIVLCGTNKTRDELNSTIRNKILGICTDYPMIGERIICRKNNWDRNVSDIPLVNGLIGTVVKQPNVSDFNGEIFSIDFLPDISQIPFIDLKVNYKYINSNHTNKELLLKNPYICGEIFEYAYSSTVHLSQGSEYSSGVIIEEFMNRNIQNALNYTAISRFKNKLVYVKRRPKTWMI